MEKDDLINSVKMIDILTNELLAIADVLEEHEVNVKLSNGSYLNPASKIRNKVDIIWDEMTAIANWVREYYE